MDRSPARKRWAPRLVGAVGFVGLVALASPAAAQTPAPPAAEAVPARPRLTGVLQKYQPPKRSLIVAQPTPSGETKTVEVGLPPNAIVIVDGIETPAAGLQAGRPVVIERRPGAPMRVVQGVLPPSRYQGITR